MTDEKALKDELNTKRDGQMQGSQVVQSAPVLAVQISPFTNNVTAGTSVRVTTSPLPPAPLQIHKAGELIKEVVETVVNGALTLALQHEPSSIEQVEINGQSVAIGNQAEHLFEEGYQALYDAKQQAIVFGSEITGLVKVAYTHVPEVDLHALSGIVPFLHQRVSALETIANKLRGGGII